MKPEQAVEKYLCKRIKEHDGYCVKLVPASLVGVPDRLVILQDGRNIYVELKTEEGKLSQIQIAVHMRLRKMHQQVYVLWSFEDVDWFIDEVVENISLWNYIDTKNMQ